MAKVLVAMSGGVDSATTAKLLTEMGHTCGGVTLHLFDRAGVTCGTSRDLEDARLVATSLGIPFFVYDGREIFKREVMGRFISAYERGETPNPCVECNRYLKFDALHRFAKEAGYDYLATGHYARVVFQDGRYLLKRAKDDSKDQTYFLYSLTQEQLSRTLFPLGEMTKAEVRSLAEGAGLDNADKPDSQDICFVSDGDYVAFLEKNAGRTYPEGDFVTKSGEVLGRHKGVVRYTVGQRRGLGIAAKEPLYVLSLDPLANTVTLGSNEDLFGTTLVAEDCNFISCDGIPEMRRLTAKIRYRHTAAPCTAWQTGEGAIRVVFDTPQRAITKGQAVVLYDGDIVVGGGRITETI